MKNGVIFLASLFFLACASKEESTSLSETNDSKDTSSEEGESSSTGDLMDEASSSSSGALDEMSSGSGTQGMESGSQGNPAPSSGTSGEGEGSSGTTASPQSCEEVVSDNLCETCLVEYCCEEVLFCQTRQECQCFWSCVGDLSDCEEDCMAEKAVAELRTCALSACPDLCSN